MKLSLILALSALCATAAFANGVEKHTLPADATHVQVSSAEVGNYSVGSKLVSDNAESGAVYESVYAEKLLVKVTYDSKDDADAPKSGSGPDGQFQAGDSTKPELLFALDLTDAQIAAVHTGAVQAKDLVKVSVSSESVSMADPNYQYHCSYDNESNVKLDDGCTEDVTSMNVTRPVVTVGVSSR